MKRSDHVQAESQQSIDNPVPHIKLSVNRIRPCTDAADYEPLEQNNLNRQDQNKRRSHQRRRQKKEGPRNVKAAQKSDSRHETENIDDREKQEGQRRVERSDSGGLEGARYWPWSGRHF